MSSPLLNQGRQKKPVTSKIVASVAIHKMFKTFPWYSHHRCIILPRLKRAWKVVEPLAKREEETNRAGNSQTNNQVIAKHCFLRPVCEPKIHNAVYQYIHITKVAWETTRSTASRHLLASVKRDMRNHAKIHAGQTHDGPPDDFRDAWCELCRAWHFVTRHAIYLTVV